MKFFKLSLLIGVLTTILVSESDAQVQYSRKYRVVAYKTGSPQVFSISNEVEIIPQMAFYIPNTFTPNGDGLNDTFGISGEAIKDFNLQIFNRWGQLVFQSGNPNERWDGSFNGEQVPQGVYVYRLSAQGPSGKKETKEGNLNVVL